MKYIAPDEISLKILSNTEKSLSSAEIGKLADLPISKISAKLKILAKEELINSPARCKYSVAKKCKNQLPP